MLRSKAEIGQTSKMHGQNAKCSRHLDKTLYFGFCLGKPGRDQRN